MCNELALHGVVKRARRFSPGLSDSGARWPRARGFNFTVKRHICTAVTVDVRLLIAALSEGTISLSLKGGSERAEKRKTE